MLAEKAMELVREATRAKDAMGPFNEDKVRPMRTLHSMTSS